MEQICANQLGMVLFIIWAAFTAYLQFVVIRFQKREIGQWRDRVQSWERYFDEIKADVDPSGNVTTKQPGSETTGI